jgi:hypothetical protein
VGRHDGFSPWRGVRVLEKALSLYSRVRGVKVLDVFLGNLEIFFCGVLFLVGWVGFG